MDTTERKQIARRLIDYLVKEEPTEFNKFIEVIESLAAVDSTFYHMMNASPAEMTTPIGALPINSTGMRALVDHYLEQERAIRDLKRTKTNLLKQLSDLQYKLNAPKEPTIDPSAPINITINIYEGGAL